MRALRYLEDKLRKQKPWLRVQKMTELHDPEFYKVYIPSDCVVWLLTMKLQCILEKWKRG